MIMPLLLDLLLIPICFRMFVSVDFSMNPLPRLSHSTRAEINIVYWAYIQGMEHLEIYLSLAGVLAIPVSFTVNSSNISSWYFTMSTSTATLLIICHDKKFGSQLDMLLYLGHFDIRVLSIELLQTSCKTIIPNFTGMACLDTIHMPGHSKLLPIRHLVGQIHQMKWFLVVCCGVVVKISFLLLPHNLYPRHIKSPVSNFW